MVRDEHDLLSVLEMLKKMRQQLTGDFKSKNREIFSPSFKYERQEKSFEIAVQKYFVGWINLHYSCFENMAAETGNSPARVNLFMQAYMKLNEAINCNSIESSTIIKQILDEKVRIYTEYLRKSEDYELKIADLEFIYERDKALFDRALQTVMEGDKHK